MIDIAALHQRLLDNLAAGGKLTPPWRDTFTRTFEKHLLDRAAGTTAWLGGEGNVEELGDGSAVLRPAVH